MEETTNILPFITAIACTLCGFLALELWLTRRLLRLAKAAASQATQAVIDSNRALIAMVEDPEAFERAKKEVSKLKQLNKQLREGRRGEAP